MKKRCFVICLTFLIFFCLDIQAQNFKLVDSLKQIVLNPKVADTTLIKVYNDLGIQLASSDPLNAKIYVRNALRIAQEIDAPRGVAGASNCLGIIHYYQKEYDSALVSFKNAAAINLKIGHAWGEASALHQIGAVQNNLSNHNQAIISFKKSGQIFLTLGDSISYTKSIENTGVSYNLMSYQKNALEYFIKANRLYENFNDFEGIARTYIHISSVLIRQKEYQKSLDYLNEALTILVDDQYNNKKHLGSIYNSMGVSHKRLHNYDKALQYFQKSLRFKIGSRNLKKLALTQSNIGDVYYEMNLYPNALDFQRKALKNYTIKGDFSHKMITHNAIAQTFLKLSILDSAKFHAHKTVSISKQIKSIEGEKNANYTLAMIAEYEGNSEAAYVHYKKLSELKDKLDKIQKKEQARELQAKYEVDKKEFQISELEQQNKEVKEDYLLLGIVLGLGILILGVGICIFRKKLKRSCLEKEQLDNELYTKKKELTTHSLHLAKKNKVLESLKEEVEHIKYSEDQNKQYNYQNILQSINFDLKEDQDWDNFTRYFEEVDKDFYCNIKNRYPHVTSNELRLMTLLKMNLSSKEIARILNITQEGVRKARYRLRKKLKIDSNNKLIDMIINS